MINILGQPPQRWWNTWVKRAEFFEEDGSWVANFQCIGDPVFRCLPRRIWDMGRGETPETCEWDVAGGEFDVLERLFRGMLSFEPNQRPTAEELLKFEYTVKWAMPAWEDQRKRSGIHTLEKR